MMLAQAFTLMFWFGAGLMAGGTILIVLAFVGAVIASAFGWKVQPWD